MQQEPFVRLRRVVADDVQLDGRGHNRLSLPGHHQPIVRAVVGSPHDEAVAEERIAVLAGRILRYVLRDRFGSQPGVHDLPVVAQVVRLPNYLVADDLGIGVLQRGVRRDVRPCPSGNVITEDVPVTAVAGQHAVVALPDDVGAGNLWRIVVVVVGEVDLGGRAGARGRVVLEQEDLVVVAVVTSPDHVVSVDLRPAVRHRIAGHLDHAIGTGVVQVDLVVLSIVSLPDDVGTGNLRVVIVQPGVIVDLC